MEMPRRLARVYLATTKEQKKINTFSLFAYEIKRIRDQRKITQIRIYRDRLENTSLLPWQVISVFVRRACANVSNSSRVYPFRVFIRSFFFSRYFSAGFFAVVSLQTWYEYMANKRRPKYTHTISPRGAITINRTEAYVSCHTENRGLDVAWKIIQNINVCFISVLGVHAHNRTHIKIDCFLTDARVCSNDSVIIIIQVRTRM